MELALRARLRESVLGAIHEVAPRISESLVCRVVERAGRDLRIALCLHRVLAVRRATDPYPPATIEPDKLDELIGILGPNSRLTLTFDDGYADAAEYIETRATRFPDVRWIFFVCPAKAERRLAFRWNVFELLYPYGSESARIELEHSGLDRRIENARLDLARAGARREFRLASVEECRQLARHENVRLGNHTDHHFPLARLSFEDAEAEIRESTSRFERLFGRCEHFAFPYGVPGRSFGPEHVAAIERIGPRISIWSTVARPMSHSALRERRVQPRFPIDGQWSAKAIALWIAALCARHRAKGSGVGKSRGEAEITSFSASGFALRFFRRETTRPTRR
ncbi:MAG: polysaccharide deacetylase family protein [Deltaproteobacteria bacterium]|nr:polysaccharide deacetylase family protein [Deltaproteobacteria bacterium]